MSSLQEPILSLKVEETHQHRGFWLEQRWSPDDRREELVCADIVLVPTIRDDAEGPVFPSGTGEFLDRLRELIGDRAAVEIAIRSDSYFELALHGKKWRIPKMIISALLLPALANILSDQAEKLLPGHSPGEAVEVHLVIEAPNHRSLEIEFNGDPKVLGAFLSTTVPRYIEELNSTPAKTVSARPDAKKSKS